MIKMDVFDFVLGPFLHDAVCEAIEYEKEEYLMNDYHDFKSRIFELLDDFYNNNAITNGKELMDLSCNLHDALEGVIQDWANDNNMLDEYIDQI